MFYNKESAKFVSISIQLKESDHDGTKKLKMDKTDMTNDINHRERARP